MTNGPLQLDAPRLARGGFRDVFQHPDHDHLLVKIVRAASRPAPASGRSWTSAYRRYGLYTPYMREMKEYVAVYARFSGTPRCIQRCYGLVDTNLGLGMVVGKLCAADGGLAPNIASIVQAQGISSRLWQSVGEFLEDIRSHGLVVNDMNPRNVVRALEDGKERLVLVDGLGEKNLLPVRTLAPAFNRMKLDRDIKYFHTRLLRVAAELHWPKRFTLETAHTIRFEEVIDRSPPA